MMDLFVKWLAVLGGAVLGGWLVGWAISWVGRSWFRDQKFPAFVAWLARLMGAILAGLLTFFLVFGGGGSGLGGTGGLSVGTKDGKKDGKELPKEEKRVKDSDAGKQGASTLRVEVLSEDALRRLLGGKEKVDRTKCYRLPHDDSPVALEDVKKAIKTGLAARPRLTRVEIVLYQDSPIEKTDVVKRLEEMARDAEPGLRVEWNKPDKLAPPR